MQMMQQRILENHIQSQLQHIPDDDPRKPLMAQMLMEQLGQQQQLQQQQHNGMLQMQMDPMQQQQQQFLKAQQQMQQQQQLQQKAQQPPPQPKQPKQPKKDPKQEFNNGLSDESKVSSGTLQNLISLYNQKKAQELQELEMLRKNPRLLELCILREQNTRVSLALRCQGVADDQA